MYVEKRNSFSCEIVCVARQEVHSCKVFCIPIHTLVVNDEVIQSFSAHEDAFYE